MKTRFSEYLTKKEPSCTKASLKRRDYHYYEWRRGERLQTFAIAAAVTLLLSYFFYRSIYAALPLSVIGVYFFRKVKKDKQKKEHRELNDQFGECILSVSTMLRAGYSIENAFLESEPDMILLYGRNSLIVEELVLIRRGLHINISLEELLNDLGSRSNSEDIDRFAEVFAIAKRNGGNLTDIIRNTAELIGCKAQMRKETEAMLRGKKMELTIMEIMPMAILFYIEVANPGYFDGLYHNLQGVVIMTLCLVGYAGAYLLGEWILNHMSEELL